MAMYRSATNYYEVSDVDTVTASVREVSGSYAPLDDNQAGMRRFRVRLPSRLKITGQRIEAAIEAERQRHREMAGD